MMPCLKSRLLYSLGFTWPYSALLKRLEACHVGCLRQVLGITTTYGAKRRGLPRSPVSRSSRGRAGPHRSGLAIPAI
eukprot:10646583-Alexandrium_andersonii.AAC.1